MVPYGNGVEKNDLANTIFLIAKLFKFYIV